MGLFPVAGGQRRSRQAAGVREGRKRSPRRAVGKEAWARWGLGQRVRGSGSPGQGDGRGPGRGRPRPPASCIPPQAVRPHFLSSSSTGLASPTALEALVLFTLSLPPLRASPRLPPGVPPPTLPHLTLLTASIPLGPGPDAQARWVASGSDCPPLFGF